MLVYVAPTASWKKYAPIFDQSAKSFRFLAGPNLSKIVLQGAQIAHGYKVAAYPGGSSFIGETTLDLCAGSYPSENLRTGRLQVSYNHPTKTVDISNEVVTYVSGGAQQALGRGLEGRTCLLDQGGHPEARRDHDDVPRDAGTRSEAPAEHGRGEARDQADRRQEARHPDRDRDLPGQGRTRSRASTPSRRRERASPTSSASPSTPPSRAPRTSASARRRARLHRLTGCKTFSPRMPSAAYNREDVGASPLAGARRVVRGIAVGCRSAGGRRGRRERSRRRASR